MPCVDLVFDFFHDDFGDALAAEALFGHKLTLPPEQLAQLPIRNFTHILIPRPLTFYLVRLQHRLFISLQSIPQEFNIEKRRLYLTLVISLLEFFIFERNWRRVFAIRL